MHSVLLLALVACLLAVPGVGAALAVFGPGEVSIITRAAAAFGLGFAAAGGCAFVLSSTHLFRLAVFLPLWLVVSAVLWVLALRRASLREQGRAALADIGGNAFPLVLGAAVLLLVLAVRFPFLYYAGGPHYVYYLNGVEIANAHGVPAATLEYGQSWAPATDKIFLDAFTGVLVLFSQNPLLGPGVLLWLSVLGSGLGLWASAWELGLRRTGGLLPLLLLANGLIFNTNMSSGFGEYRAEDFGRAVAFCALALGIVAIREGGWRRGIVAGVVLAAASGSHLIPVVVVVLMLTCAGLARLLFDPGWRARAVTLGNGLIVGGSAAVLGVLIRVFAGGAFGLGGASNQSAYNAIHTPFDPTDYLYTGAFVRRAPATGGPRPYLPVHTVVETFTSSGLGLRLLPWQVMLLLGAGLAASIVLFILVKTDLRIVGLVGSGVFAGIVAVSLAFDYRYHIYIDATFGQRRLGNYSSVGLILVGLALLEGLFLLLERVSQPVLIAGVTIPVVLLTAWLLPSGRLTPALRETSQQRIALVNWIRAHTPCGARFVVSQRSEGTLASLTGREAVSEGMGPFLRPDKLPYVTTLMLGLRSFYQNPHAHEAFLRQYGISYVIEARKGLLLGYGGPEGHANYTALKSAPFLRLVYHSPAVQVYRVTGAATPPPSPLLTGPYLHCLKRPVHF